MTIDKLTYTNTVIIKFNVHFIYDIQKHTRINLKENKWYEKCIRWLASVIASISCNLRKLHAVSVGRYTCEVVTFFVVCSYKASL